MKPSWSEAPKWAMWLAQNEDGQWWWYESEPEISHNMGYYFVDDGRSLEATCAEDWDDSLEKRP